MLGFLLLALIPVAAVAYIVWAHRKRTAERAAASSKRFADMFGAPAAVQRSAPTMPVAASAPVALGTRRETLLDRRRLAVFRSLAAALPDHQVCPSVTLAALVDLPSAVQGREREQRLRALAQNTLDFVICDMDMRPVAAVDVDEGASAESRIKSEYLGAAGIRHVRLQPDISIQPDEMRKRIFGSLTERVA